MTAQTAPQYTDRRQDYKPRTNSKIPYNFSAFSWDVRDNPAFKSLKWQGAKLLYHYLNSHVDISDQCATSGYLRGFTFPMTYDHISQDCFNGEIEADMIGKYVKALREAGLITTHRTIRDGFIYQISAYQNQAKIEVFEANYAKPARPKLAKPEPVTTSIPELVPGCTNINKETSKKQHQRKPETTKTETDPPSSTPIENEPTIFPKSMSAWNQYAEKENQHRKVVFRAAPAKSAEVGQYLMEVFGSDYAMTDLALEHYIKYQMPHKTKSGSKPQHMSWISSAGYWQNDIFSKCLQHVGFETQPKAAKAKRGLMYRQDNETPRAARFRIGKDLQGETRGPTYDESPEMGFESAQMGTTTGALLDEMKKGKRQ